MAKFGFEAAIALAILAAAFAAGWVVNGWRYDAGRLESERAVAQSYAARVESFDRTAAETITKLIDSGEKQTIVQREVIREVEKYRERPCFDSDVIRLLNVSATGGDTTSASDTVPTDARAAD